MKYSKDIVLRGVELVQLWSKVSTGSSHKIRTELRRQTHSNILYPPSPRDIHTPSMRLPSRWCTP
jgi:hypothetical protein